MFCSNCGTENPETSSFCSKCGERINGSTSELLKTKKHAKRTTLAISALAILLLTVALFLNLAKHGPLLTILLDLLADGAFIYVAARAL